MRRQGRLRFNRCGFLLVEAALTAVIMAVGLVLITRGLGGSVAALARVRQREVLLQLAESTMNEREVEAQRFGVAPRTDVSYDAPFERYRWTLSVQQAQQVLADVEPNDMRHVTITVTCADKPGGLMRLQALWPRDWIKE